MQIPMPSMRYLMAMQIREYLPVEGVIRVSWGEYPNGAKDRNDQKGGGAKEK